MKYTAGDFQLQKKMKINRIAEILALAAAMLFLAAAFSSQLI